jgi:DNA-binding NtrC family response regulator
MIEEALEEGGYHVVMAMNGTRGWALLEENGQDFSALVTGIRAGEGPNGWEIARHARHLKPEMAVTYVTGDAASDWAA